MLTNNLGIRMIAKFEANLGINKWTSDFLDAKFEKKLDV